MSRATKKNSKAVSGIDPFDAADFARLAALEDAKNEKFVGAQISVESDDDHVATYLFEAFLPGYVGWRWAVTVAKVDDKSAPTICDVVLLPGSDALLAPEWIPYSQRITADDVGVGTIVPTEADDPRLVPANAALPSDEELDLHELFELGAGRLRRLVRRDAAQPRAGVLPQPRTLPVSKVGHAGVRHLQGGSARHRPRAPG